MTVSNGDILRVVQNLVWSDGNINQNVYNCTVESGPDGYADQDVADDMADWMDTIYANIVANISNAIVKGETVTYKWDTVNEDWDEVGGALPTFTPANSNDYFAPGLAALVKCNTTDPDVQGRKFFSGFAETQATYGYWIAGQLTSLVALASDWITAFVGGATGATFTPGTWSPTQKLIFDFVVNYIVAGAASYQRRRKPGVGM